MNLENRVNEGSAALLCSAAMSHRPFWCYQQDVIAVLRERVGVPILADWWKAQTRPDGQHRTWTHYQMGLSSEQSAEEMRPFAEAQLVRPRPKDEHWKDVCIVRE